MGKMDRRGGCWSNSIQCTACLSSFVLLWQLLNKPTYLRFHRGGQDQDTQIRSERNRIGRPSRVLRLVPYIGLRVPLSPHFYLASVTEFRGAPVLTVPQQGICLKIEPSSIPPCASSYNPFLLLEGPGAVVEPEPAPPAGLAAFLAELG